MRRKRTQNVIQRIVGLYSVKKESTFNFRNMFDLKKYVKFRVEINRKIRLLNLLA